MKGLQLTQPGIFETVDLPKPPSLKENEVLLSIKSIGICGTDYHAYNGKQPFFSYPRILGHELGAQIKRIGKGANPENFKIGDKVAVEPYLNCGICQSCLSLKQNCCETLSVMGVHCDGGMSREIIMPIDKIHASNQLTYEQLALVETLGIGYHANKRAQVTDKDTILVLGAGPIGLSIAQFAKIVGAKVFMADFNKERLTFALKHKLTSDIILLDTALSQEKLKADFKGFLPTIIYDATGRKDSMENCFNLAPAGGKIVFVGLFIGDMSFNDPNFHKKELTVLSSRNALPSDFKSIIKMMEEGILDTNPWISHRANFSDFQVSFSKWREPNSKVIKAIVNL